MYTATHGLDPTTCSRSEPLPQRAHPIRNTTVQHSISQRWMVTAYPSPPLFTKANNFCCFYKMASPCESPESSESACSLLGSKSTEGGPARLLPVTTTSTPHTVSIQSSKQDGISKQSFLSSVAAIQRDIWSQDQGTRTATSP
jgi:hypothetical protein